MQTIITTDICSFSAIDDHQLERVIGGAGDAGKCVDDIVPWAAGGALAGALGGPASAGVGAIAGAGAASLTSVNCGDGTNSPATLIRRSVTGTK